MTAVAQPRAASARREARESLALGWIAFALMVPMFVSGLVFNTYDIALSSLLLEILRQLNAPFVLAELVVIGIAVKRGLRASPIWNQLDRPAKLAAGVFLTVFWIGGVVVSKAAPFATLFNLSYLVHLMFGFAVAHLVPGSEEEGIPDFAKLVAALLLLFAFAIAVQFAYPPVGRAAETINWQFAVPGFISVRLFGAIVAPCLAFFAWLAVERGQEPQFRTWPLLASALAAGLLCWSGTRAGLVGCAVTGAVAIIYFRLQWRTAAVGRVAIAVIVGGLCGMALAPYGDPDFLLFTPRDIGGADALSGGRLSFWASAWDAYLSVKWIGAGPGATAWILPPSQYPHIQPHNLILEFLLNWGGIAAAAAFYLLARLVAAVHRRAKAERPLVPFVLLADCLLVMGLFDGTFHFAQHLMMGAAAAGIVLARSPLEGRGKRQQFPVYSGR